MRGKAKELPPRQCYLGITPAYAGKSTRPFSSGHENGDHPRVCGEKQKTPPWGVEKGGSPPRMRGKGVQPRDKRVAVRITPAYAGKRGRTSICLCNIRDHPRVCGEKKPIHPLVKPVLGSPPRMRGKGVPDSRHPQGPGITPAYAGKRKSYSKHKKHHRDHPRVCGEKENVPRHSLFGLGSPPRMRGKVVQRGAKLAANGITPAYAGKRLKRSHRIGHFSCILCLFHSVLHRASASGGSRAGPCAPPCLPAQNAVPV